MPISDLRRMRVARSRYYKSITKHELALAVIRDKLARVETAISEICPELDVTDRRRARHPLFGRGEITRLAMDVLRTAEKPLTAPEIAVRMFALKGNLLPEPAQRRRLRFCLSGALSTMRERGLLVRDGTIWDARWSVT